MERQMSELMQRATTSTFGEYDTFLVAFCGIDGAGKGVLIRHVIDQNLLPGATCVKNEAHRDFDLVRRFNDRRFHDGRDWLEGGFSRTMPFARAFDFLHFYRQSIEPLFGTVPFIIADRYALCAAAYLNVMGYDECSRELFAGIRPPDLTIYVTTDIELLEDRYNARGNRSEDEIPRLMQMYQREFDAIVRDSNDHIINIHNDGDVESACLRVAEAINDALISWSVLQ